MCICIVFFFKQKTAYEMRISDWSSDVCSSDLPLILDTADPRFGEQLETAKPGWTGSNLVKALGQAFDAPVAIDTDVNAAALAEHRLGAGQGYEPIAYLTIGTGIGAGLSGPSGTLRGALHPEVGHIILKRQPEDRAPSSCPFHRAQERLERKK